MGFSIVRIEGIEGTAKPPNRPSNAIRPTTPGMTTRLSRLCSATMPTCPTMPTVRHRGIETGISEASKRVSIFSFATQGGKQVSFYF